MSFPAGTPLSDAARRLFPIFHPAAVAVVGATEAPGKAAERRTRSLLEGAFPGKVYLINPRRERLFGRPAFPSLKEVDGPLDLALIVIPGPHIPQAVQDAAEKGARGVVIITAGLGESGPEGKQIEAKILGIAESHGIQLIGPNCSGMYSASGQMNFLGIPMIRPGSLSVLAQSGNIIDSLTHYARRRGRGFSRIISSGNAIGVRFHDYIEFLAEDPETRVILLYLETMREGAEFIRACRKATRRKPIIAIKVGGTAAGRRASASHTGALAADDRIVEAAFAQAGILRVANIDEMFDLAEAFLDCPAPRGNRVAILSEGGGDNSLAADNAERRGLAVPVLSEAAQARVRPHLLSGMPAHNPIDYGGTAEENPAVVAACVEAVMAADEVDMVYLTGFFGGFKDIIAPHVGALETEAAKRLVELVRRYQKPLAVHTSFALEDYDALKVLKQGGIPVQISSDRIAQCLAALARHAARESRPSEPPRPPEAGPARRARAQETIAAARAQGRRSLLEPEALEILRCHGLPVPEAVFARSASEAAHRSREIGFPVALKIVSPDILHKSDVGGVRLGLGSASAVRGAARAILERVRASAPAARIEGFLVTPMAPPGGRECIFGIFRDPGFGPVVMFGLGGVFVEVLKDVAFGIAPLSTADARRMIRSIRGLAVLEGVRGEAARDLAALERLVEGLSRIAVENPGIAEMDLNPVIVHAHGLSLVDARILLAE
jgi:acetyltransferase